ncbi:MAG: cytochrome c [Azospirillum sp.]|nr:cytochrome c [Azospirillum sp.]
MFRHTGRKLVLGGLVVIGLGVGVGLAATPEEQVGYRQDQMKSMGKAIKKVFSFVKNEGGTIADVAAGAKIIYGVSETIETKLFPAGTAVGVDDSAAKPEIWKEWDHFKELAGGLEKASEKLMTVAVDGADPDAVKAAAVAVGKACGACHETYKMKKD